MTGLVGACLLLFSFALLIGYLAVAPLLQLLGVVG